MGSAAFRAGLSDATTDTPRAGGETTEPNLAAATEAAEAFLRALGVPVHSEERRDTPHRMARSYADLFTAPPFSPTTLPNNERYDELVVARELPVRSVCEHHMLPITGTACVGYLPADRTLGPSQPARTVAHFAHRPQVQERLTKQIADSLDQQLRPRAVGVVIRAEHSCMTSRGVHAAGSTTITSTLLGTFRSDPDTRHEFLALAGIGAPSAPGR